MGADLKKYEDKLIFLPLGGSNEIGMNLNLYGYKGSWIMIDLGIGFADDYLPGVDIVLPDIDALLEQDINLEAIILTHAHEDHIGAMPYLWEEFDAPVYTTPFTAAVVKRKMAQAGVGKKLGITEIQPGETFTIGSFTLEAVPLTHSIPEMHALAIRTDKGVVFHTGDWKFDDDPLVGPTSDLETLSRYGEEGVLALVCDSTNVFEVGESGSESGVRKRLIDTVRDCKELAVVTTFASNVARVESIMEAAKATGRKVVLAGRSLQRLLDSAQEAGYLTDLPPIINDREWRNFPRNEVLVIATGCQGEPRAALNRLARQDHPVLALKKGDSVIFSSRVIPGNAGKVNWLMNALTGLGVEVITDKMAGVHVSGHPALDELQEMYRRIQPKIAVPVHGERQHIHAHAKLARSLQVPQVVEPFNGAVIELNPEGGSKVIDRLETGYIAMDGDSMIPSDSQVLSSRRKQRDAGCIFVSMAVDTEFELQDRPSVSTPGVLDPREDSDLAVEMMELLEHTLESLPKKQRSINGVEQAVRHCLRKWCRHETGKRPMIEVHVHIV